MDMIPIRTNLQKRNFEARFHMRTDLTQSVLDRSSDIGTTILGGTNQMVEQNTDIVTLVDVLTHEPL